MRGLFAIAVVSVLLIAGCGGAGQQSAAGPVARPSILLVTLDTTRADSIGPDARTVETPAFNALAARGRRFRHAYATAPETLPSHSSMMTGLYPAGHGVHENARYLGADHAVAAERLRGAGYRTAAFVSSFVLSRRFGLGRGFDVYNDELGSESVERTSNETTGRAIDYLSKTSPQPLFMWVHYFDPHTPYEPPEPFRSKYPDKPYLGEIAAMDRDLDLLIKAFEQHAPTPTAVIVVGDHGEGLGDHGELQHGNLLYQATMQVPMLAVGPGVTVGVNDTPVSTRRVFHTILDWAGLDATGSLRGSQEEVVLGEAMKPFLGYGWQPQIMAIEGVRKAILAGKLEIYDLAADPSESRNLGSGSGVSAAMRKALDEYPVPSLEAAPSTEDLSAEAKRNLASLGYVSASAPPVVRRDAPRPADMLHLFGLLEKASGLFVQERYAEVIPLLQRILSDDPNNLDAALRLATAYSSLGQNDRALAAFKRAAAIAPRSPDVRIYLALHYTRGKDWQLAAPILEQAVAETPDRVPAVDGLATVRERQGRIEEAVQLRQKIYATRAPTAPEMVQLGRLAMSVQQTPLAIDSFEKARAMQGAAFKLYLELGVLYLAARRLHDARDALDRVTPVHPEYPMALFKRAQVSVLLNEPDRAARIDRARAKADKTTRALIAREKLFQK